MNKPGGFLMPLPVKMILLFVCFGWCCLATAQTYLFAGNYTGGKPGNGLYVYRFDTAHGTLKALGHTENINNPSFIDIAPDGKFLYACTDTKLLTDGNVSAYAIDSINGRLAFINRQSAAGPNPVYVAVHQNGRFVANANYNQGSISIYKTNKDGSLSPKVKFIQFNDSSVNKERQETSHIHAAVFSPDGNFMVAPDLGADKIRVFRFNTTGRQPLLFDAALTVSTQPGGGPRHFVFHPKLKTAYCFEELSGNIVAYKFEGGHLDVFQSVGSYATVQKIYSGADIHISPDGLFLYASNRIENSISIFSIDVKNGSLVLKGHQATLGDHPRNFLIDPNGKFLLVANQVSGTIMVFKRNAITGLLNYMSEVKIEGGPSSLKMRTYRSSR